MLKHIIIGWFETFEPSRQTLVRSLQDLLKQYGLTIWFQNIFAYVKDENANLNTMTTTLKLIISKLRKFLEAWNMFPLNQPKQICKMYYMA
jgi:hypothetical protein